MSLTNEKRSPTSSTTEIKLTMTDPLESHTDPTNPFAFTPPQLSALMDPKNMILLSQFGGLQGVALGLHASLTLGLSATEQTCHAVSPNSSPEEIDDEKLATMRSRDSVFGRNVLPPVKSKTIFELMWCAFKDRTLILLTVAAVVSLGIGLYEDIAQPEFDKHGNRIPGVKWVEGVAIIVAVLIVILVGSINDYQKEKQFQKLNAKKEDRMVKATREGAMTLLSVHDILVGDILHLEPGDIVAADGLFIDGHQLKCDESAATGESDEISKSQAMDPFILSGSKVVEGIGSYLVTGVGIHSYNGRILMALRTKIQSTPLQEKLNDLAEMIAKVGSVAGLIMLVAVLIRYFVGWTVPGMMPTVATTIVADVMNILIVVVTIVVVAVPEGLPLAVTLALAYATQRMLKDNNLVRVLAACETMGNVTTVCSDKTGTLTQNKMTVVAGTLGAFLDFDAIAGDLDPKIAPLVLLLVHDGIAINSTAFQDEEGGEFVGNKTETALLTFAQNTGAAHYTTLRTQYPTEQMYPFSSSRKAMATVIRIPHPTVPGQVIFRAHVKGASEIVMGYCSKIITATGATTPLSDDDRQHITSLIQTYASKSLRTIGLAYRDFEQWPPIDDSFDSLLNDLVMLSVVGIEDPLRPGVKEAVRACQQAGVIVRMVTGDNLITAKSIAQQCGIYHGNGIVMEGPVFRALSETEMDAILPRLQVLARSSPQDKQLLVGRLQAMDDVVAVTGDGTNDGPALKMANVGFSMGITGTEVAKEASSIILMDDNFSSIVKAIMWGRCVNDSVKKFLEFQLTVNITAVMLTFISAVVSSEQKSVLTAVQLLWVNLIMDTFAALALATDAPTEALLVDRVPEPRSAPLISFKMWKMIIGQAIFQIAVTLVLLYGDLIHNDSENDELQTIVFNTFVFCQLFNEINCRRIDSKLNVFSNILANRFFVFIFVLCVFLQCVIVNFGGAAFQVTRVDGTAWAISIVIGLFSLPVGMAVRLIPDELFGFVFYGRPESRERYLGGQIPSMVYATDNGCVVYQGSSDTTDQEQSAVTIGIDDHGKDYK